MLFVITDGIMTKTQLMTSNNGGIDVVHDGKTPPVRLYTIHRYEKQDIYNDGPLDDASKRSPQNEAA